MRVPATPPKWKDAFVNGEGGFVVNTFLRKDVQELVRSTNEKYLHWDKLRHLPLPKGLNAAQSWAAIEIARQPQFRSIPLTFGKKSKLKFWIPPQHHEWLSRIDQKAGGTIGSQHKQAVPDDEERYLFNSLMEEAIASSQIEGASTTREVAKEMLRTKRRPRDKAEQMILNNYKAILDIRERKDDPLTPALLCHLQRVLTEETLDRPGAAGRFRRSDEQICVADPVTNETIYDPPDASVVESRVQEICDFANAKSVPFVHPIVKAMAIHFAIGYVHPFVDGNGRTARAVFYWYMLKSGFWLFEYLPISRIIADSPVRYGRAYLYTETDNGDLTYFNHYHLNVVNRAIDELYLYLEKQQRFLCKAEQLLDSHPSLNHRQKSMVQDALKHPKRPYTIREHEGKFRVTYNTARNDLIVLEKLGILWRTKYPREKETVFLPAPGLVKQLKSQQLDSLSGKADETARRRKPEKNAISNPVAKKRHKHGGSLFDMIEGLSPE